MRADDLTNLLAPAGAADVGFHQGTVTAWNASTGANTISVSGATLTDVPILNTGEAIALKPGHVVGLLRFKSTYFILGRITIPGNPDFAGASVAFDEANTQADNFSLSTSFATKATATLVVPSWADEALVMATVGMTILNSTGAQNFVDLEAVVGGAFGVIHRTAVGISGGVMEQVNLSNSDSRVITSPGSTIVVTADARAAAAISANAGNRVNVNAIAVYRSVT